MTSVVVVSLVAASTVPAVSAAWAGVRVPSARSAVTTANKAQVNHFGSAVWSVRNMGPVWMSSPLIATIDGVKAVVMGTLSGEVYVLNAKSGAELPGWPEFVHINSPAPTAIDSSPAVAYLDGPNRPPSIIVGAGSLWRRHQQGGLEAFYASGKVRFVFQTRRTFNPWGGSGPANYSDPVFATPAVGDITGTGQLDIVFGSYDHYIYALQPNGRLVPGFPVNRADTIWSSPTLIDTSHTGRDDIIMGTDASGWHGCRGGWLVDYRYVGGAPKLVWQRCISQTIWSSPTVGILNDTGRPAVVVGTSYYRFYSSSATDEIFAFYADNGQPVPGWPVRARGPTFGSPAIGRLDGEQAVVATSRARGPGSPGVISAWNGSGRLLWSRVFAANNEANSSPVLVDITGGRDDGDDVLVGGAWGLYLLSGKNGSFLYNNGAKAPTLDVGCTPSSAAIGYVPGAPGNGWMLYSACGGPNVPTTLAAYPFPIAPAASDPPSWPEWRANADRTGVADPVSVPRTWCGPISPKVSGYRIATSDGKVFTRGNLAYCGGLNDSVLPSPVVSMASTPSSGGYWLLLGDGSVYAFGNATFLGDLRGGAWHGGPVPPGAPAVGIAATPDGKGYFITAADGSVYAFGDATYHGSQGGQWTNGPIVGMAVDPATGGYWLTTSTGAVYGEDAPNFGSTADRRIPSPIVAMAAAPGGTGYWLAAKDGHVYSYGAAAHVSATHGLLASPVIGIASNSTGGGYWLATADGAIVHVGRGGAYASVHLTAHSEPLTAFSSAS
jgi:hypothetical protein